MAHRNNSALLFLFAACMVAAPSLARAQSVDTSKPVAVKGLKTPKPVKFLGEVLFSNAQSITVRSRQDLRIIRTFTYASGIRDKMLQILEQGGYQYGDKVEITSEPGRDVALRIKGKPSKPI